MHSVTYMFLHNYLPYRLNLLAELTSGNTRDIYRKRHGLTRSEWRVLVNLAEAPSLTASDLCTRVPAHKTKVSRALAALETRGWIKRSTDPKDRRIAHTTLTLKGKRALAKIQPEMEAATNALLAPLSPQDRARLDEGLAVLERLFKTDTARP
ncbi:MarR family transcriptional regulator [Pararhodobacter sp.]|uniref:MarR family winged helix-turn-helix transcriptional regulator n=1 Tax=Pararhodobacter sp. TaxID=2127056 RepID=UPI002AFDEE88|nr:MarR family transcriptional regulator [Pararhodobacter sp.]